MTPRWDDDADPQGTRIATAQDLVVTPSNVLDAARELLADVIRAQEEARFLDRTRKAQEEAYTALVVRHDTISIELARIAKELRTLISAEKARRR